MLSDSDNLVLDRLPYEEEVSDVVFFFDRNNALGTNAFSGVSFSIFGLLCARIF